MVGKRALLVIGVMLCGSVAALPGTSVVTDVQGDAKFVAGDTAQQAIDLRWQASDFLEVAFDEDEELFHVWLEVASLQESQVPELLIADQQYLDVFFDVGAVTYVAGFSYIPQYPLTDTVYVYGRLGAMTASDSFPRFIDFIEVEANFAENTLHAMIPRGLLVDETGAKPLPGDQITGFRAESSAIWAELAGIYPSVATGQHWRYEDRAPDTGNADFTWEVQFGSIGTGHGLLTCEEPFRISNGEATTMLYRIQLTNTADFTDTFSLEATGVPDQWVVTFPTEEIRVTGGETADIVLLATVPFAHNHGTRDAFEVTSHSLSDPLALSTIELGISYTAIPQPAGHHNMVYVHNSAAGIYLNTLEVDDQDSGEKRFSRSSGGGTAGTTYYWQIPLSPGLRMGMDWDLSKTGTIRLPIEAEAPAMDATIQGNIWLAKPNDFFLRDALHVATIPESESADIMAGATATFESDIIPQAAGDYWPYESGYNLVMEIELYVPSHPPLAFAFAGTPAIAAGGVLDLPLEEFHDDVDQFFSALSGVEVRAITEQQRLVNPGETVMFRVDATNIGATAGTFDLEITGTQLEWVDILGDTRISLGAGETRELALSVRPASGATDGELVDVTLHASKSDDSNVRSLIRLLAEVDTEADHPDEAAEAQEIDSALSGKEAPGPGIVMLLAMSALIAVRRRR